MKKKQTALEYVLLSLIPYTKPNLKLVFLPRRFFSDLEKTSRINSSTLKTTLYRAQRQGFVERVNGIPVLTEKGKAKIKPFRPKKLNNNAKLMVIFDIPEEIGYKRRQFRSFLKYHDFKQVQKSVWISDYDYIKELKSLVDELHIKSGVEIFECVKL